MNVVQKNSQSVLLNRVVGNDMSQIRGQISANGQVVLVNPNGIVMGPTGRITASAFTASTFGITDANFLAGKKHFERNGSNASVVNQGTIQTTEAGGYVALIGAEVSNEGTIQTRQGAVVLAAAERVGLPSAETLNNVRVPLSSNVSLELDPAAFGSANVSNSGIIKTEGGQVLLRAAAVVDAVSKVAAARVTHTGTIDTTGEQGGRVDILADHGHVRVSGTVKANSTDGSVGGKVFIGRDEQTNVLAAVGDASGARIESKGGFVETSGHFLAINGTRVLAKDWLLDPFNVLISSNPSIAYTVDPPPVPTEIIVSPVQNESVFFVEDIVANLNAGVNLTIQTTNTDSTGNQGTQAGNITVANNIRKTAGADATLTLKAHNDIVINSGVDITSTVGKLNVVLNSDSDGNGQGAIEMESGSSIVSNGGHITLGGGVNGNGAAHGHIDRINGVSINNAILNAGGGNISLKGRSGAVTIIHASGVSITNGSRISTSGTGSVTIEGTGAATGGGSQSMGVRISGSNATTLSTVSAGSGGINITGTGSGSDASSTGNNQHGVMVTNAKVSATGGNVSLTGTGGNAGGGEGFKGISLETGAEVSATGAGTVSLTGTGGLSTGGTGAAGSNNGGVGVNSGAVVKTETGAINITGTAPDNRSYATALAGDIKSTANGNITVTTDSLDIGGLVDAGTGTVTIQNQTAGTRITIGGTATSDVRTTNPKTLVLGDSELAKIKAGTTVIGRNDGTGSGNVTTQAMDIKDLGNMTVLSGNDITVSGAITKTAGGNAKLTLNAKNGVDLNANISATSGQLDVDITAEGLNTSTATSSRGLVLRNSTINANGGEVKLTGSTTATLADQTPTNNADSSLGKGVSFIGTSGIDAAEYTVKGTSDKSYGVYFGPGRASLKSSEGSSLVEGQTTTSGWSGLLVNNGSTVNITATGEAKAQMSTSANSNAGVRFGWNGGSTVNTNGDVTLGSKNNGKSGFFFQGNINAQSGTLTVLGKSDTGNGVSTQDSGGNKSHLTGTNGAKIIINGESKSAAGVNLQAAGSVVQEITASGTASDGSKSSISITGTSETSFGIYVGTSNVSNTNGDVTLMGKGLGSGTTQSGVGINNAGTLSASGKLSVTGDARGNNGIFSTGSFTSTAGDVEINATTTNIGIRSAVALNVQGGTITADQKVVLSGDINSVENSNAAVLLTNVTAKANKGTLSVDADTDGNTTWGTILGINTKLLTSNQAITISTDSLALDTSANPATVDAGTGTVTIQNKRQDVQINVGGDDVAAAAASGRTLGVNNNELNRINAGKLVIGQQGANASGNMTVSTNVTTKTATGDVTLNTGGNLSVNGNWTVGDTGNKDLTINATGNVGRTSADVRLTADEIRIKAGGFVGEEFSRRLQTSANTLAVQSGGNQWLHELNGTEFAATSTSGNINLTSNSGSVGVNSLLAADGSTLKGITAVGKIVTLGVLDGSVFNSTGNSDGLITSNALNIKAGGTVGQTGRRLATKVDALAVVAGTDIFVAETDGVNLAALATNGSVNVSTGNGAMTLGSLIGAYTETVTGVRAKTGVTLSTGTGNITVNQNISNTGSGDVVLAAGTSKAASDGTGGDIKTTAGKTISNVADGKTYLYTGTVAGTGKLSDAVSTLDTLYLSKVDDNKTNTVSKVGFTADHAAAVSGGANTQVFFREAINLGTAVELTSSTVTKTYGDVAFADVSALKTEIVNKIKENNSGVIEKTSTTGAATSIKINASDLVDSLNVSRTYDSATEKSTSEKLKANTDGYAYNLTAGDKYNVTISNNTSAKVVVDKKALTGSIAQGNTTYGDALAAGAVTLTNKVGSDVVAADGVTISTTGLTSTSGKLKAGTHTGIQSVTALTGADKDNYTFAEVKGDYKVDKLALTGAAIADVTTTYGTEKATGAVSFGNVQGSGETRDKVTATASLVDAATSTSGNLKAGEYQQTASAITGDDSANYTFSGVTTAEKNYTVAQKSITINGLSAQDKAFDNSTSAKWSGEAELEGKVAGDKLELNISAANFISPEVGSNKPVTLTGALAGDDQENYLLNLPQLVASITNAVEPVVPPTPVVPVIPSTPTTVVTITSNNNFQLAGVEGATLLGLDADEYECESASSAAGEALDGIQICFASGSSAKE